MNMDRILQAAINAAIREAVFQVAVNVVSNIHISNKRQARKEAWRVAGYDY